MAQDERILTGGPVTQAGDYGYMPGFGNTHSSEALAGALPIGRNSPQRPRHGLYAEQLSGTAFTAPRAANRRAWLYRMRPSVRHGTGFEPLDEGLLRTAPCVEDVAPVPAQLRWGPWPLPDTGDVDFIAGLTTITTCGDAAQHTGIAAHVYAANRSMHARYFMNADGELALLPEHNALRVITEFGILRAEPGEMVVVPRGVKFRVELPDGPARGFVLENYGQILALPERGPIGANALANERDFLYPAAAYEDADGDFEFVMKWQGRLFATRLGHSPLDVVAWHGNYAPYKYDLRRFNTIGSISFDHPDPSIFTVLTSASPVHGTANVDFVIFPERWLVMEDTFRPPWFHTNVMSEFMGLLYGVYDAKPGGFSPGGMSLHNAMLPHGPDAEAFAAATRAELAPEKLGGTLAFMFETRLIQNPTAAAANAPQRDAGYAECWRGLGRNFPADT